MFAGGVFELDHDELAVVGGIGVLVWAVMTSVTIYVKHSTPDAIDVYQGITTLKYTYVDGIAIDSTVVYKGSIQELS